MGNPRSLLRRLKTVDIDQVSRQSIEETEAAFTELNLQQMYAGLKNDGSEIAPPYVPATVRRKRKIGQPTDRVTLKDMGDFYAGYTVSVEGNIINELSTDFKMEFLIKRYGKEIFGLGGSYRKEYISDNLRPVFVKNMKQEIGLNS